MDWEHQSVAAEFIRQFVEHALPDARRWEIGACRVVAGEECWHVEIDIPTSALPCWIGFDLVTDENGSVTPTKLFALRSGREADLSSVYAWDVAKEAWQLMPGREMQG